MKKILIVDDEPAMSRFVKEILTEHKGLSVESALNGRECLEKIKKGAQYDLILMDIMMPGMDGYELSSRLKSSSGNFRQKILFYSVLPEETIIAKMGDSGADGYISKSGDPEALLHRVVKELGLD